MNKFSVTCQLFHHNIIITSWCGQENYYSSNVTHIHASVGSASVCCMQLLNGGGEIYMDTFISSEYIKLNNHHLYFLDVQNFLIILYDYIDII